MTAIFTRACFEKKKETLEGIFLLPCLSSSPSSQGSPSQSSPCLLEGGLIPALSDQLCSQASHSILAWLLSVPSVPLPSMIAVSSLGLRSLSSPIKGSALIPSPARSLRPCSRSPDGCRLSCQRGCTAKPGGLGSFVCSRAGEGGPPAGVSCCLATYFSLLRLSFPLAAPADAHTTDDSNITAPVAPATVCLLFTVIAVKGFVNISSHPSLVKTGILTCFCGTPA